MLRRWLNNWKQKRYEASRVKWRKAHPVKSVKQMETDRLVSVEELLKQNQVLLK